MEAPSIPANLVPAEGGDVIHLGRGVICRIMEDGSRTGEPKRLLTTHLTFHADQLWQIIASDPPNSLSQQIRKVHRLIGMKW
jgi:hypothetical protein